jgi:hypothetical protein
MGLTILAFLSVPAFIAFIVVVMRRGRSTVSGRLAAVVSGTLALYCLAQGFAFLVIGPDFSENSALALTRLSYSLVFVSFFLLLIFSINFPTPLPSFVQRLAWIVFLPLTLIAVYDTLFTSDCVFSVSMPISTILRLDGQYYTILVAGAAALALLSALVLGIRALTAKNATQRQRAAVAAISITVGAAVFFVATALINSGEAERPSFVFAPVCTVLIAGGVTYAFQLSRLFDRRAIARTALGYGALLGAVGLPTGIAVALLLIAGRATSPVLPAVGGFSIFIIASLLGRRFFARFFARLGSRGEYREKLEAALAKVDLAQGRDAVLAEVYGHLQSALDLKDFTVLIDDDQGFMRTVYAPTGGRAIVERGSPLSELLEKTSSNVLIRSEAETDAAYAELRGGLLELFDSLKAEALVIILEGRRSIGLFGLGARSTGADYTAYDYDSFRAIYGKLFVIAYYLKNIARESIMTTVDREIALSDQIIRFALEKVDRIEHPNADVSWVSRSARSLGGDFIDFVRLSADRWFVVMGDVSGKGLSASMNMLILKSMIRTFLRVERDFVGLVSRVNAFIKENLPKGTFFAGVFGYLDLSKEAFYYINCGVPMILLYSPSFDTFIEVQGEGKILGFVKDVSPFLKPRKLALSQGSALVTSTDGILDAENLRGERFGKERLRRSVHSKLALTAAEITAGAMEDFLTFTDRRQEDDITLFVMKLNARSAT